MLLMKPNCEWCDRDLPPSATEARICSFECTWCEDCIDGPDTPLAGVCPNCGGGVERRPVRPDNLLEAAPPETERTINPAGPAAA